MDAHNHRCSMSWKGSFTLNVKRFVYQIGGFDLFSHFWSLFTPHFFCNFVQNHKYYHVFYLRLKTQAISTLSWNRLKIPTYALCLVTYGLATVSPSGFTPRYGM